MLPLPPEGFFFDTFSIESATGGGTTFLEPGTYDKNPSMLVAVISSHTLEDLALDIGTSGRRSRVTQGRHLLEEFKCVASVWYPVGLDLSNLGNKPHGFTVSATKPTDANAFFTLLFLVPLTERP